MTIISESREITAGDVEIHQIIIDRCITLSISRKKARAGVTVNTPVQLLADVVAHVSGYLAHGVIIETPERVRRAIISHQMPALARSALHHCIDILIIRWEPARCDAHQLSPIAETQPQLAELAMWRVCRCHHDIFIFFHCSFSSLSSFSSSTSQIMLRPVVVQYVTYHTATATDSTSRTTSCSAISITPSRRFRHRTFSAALPPLRAARPSSWSSLSPLSAPAPRR